MRVEQERIRLLAKLEELMAQQDMVFHPLAPHTPSGVADLDQFIGQYQELVVRGVRSLQRPRHISSIFFRIDEDRFCVHRQAIFKTPSTRCSRRPCQGKTSQSSGTPKIHRKAFGRRTQDPDEDRCKRDTSGEGQGHTQTKVNPESRRLCGQGTRPEGHSSRARRSRSAYQGRR